MSDQITQSFEGELAMRYLIIFTIITTLVIATEVSSTILTQLTTNPGIDGGPTWSPDGRTIAYAASPNVSSRPWEDNSFDIWTIPATGGTPTKLADYDFASNSPEYSPDGSRILYTTKENINSGIVGIWSIPSSGGPRTKVFKGAWANDYAGDWSPDGSEIVFISERGASGPGGQNVWIVSSDGSGSGLRQLTFGNPGDGDPDWSPDGSTIAFFSNIRSGRGDIWTIPAAGGTPARLTNNPDWGGGGGPAYSPDGRWIAFVSDRNQKLGIWVMPATGGERTLIVEYDVGGVGYPCWSLDAAKIAFTRWPEDGSNASDVWIASDLPYPISPIPEPSTVLLLTTGLGGIIVFGKAKLHRKRRS